jgi:fatty-acyl-CoA synthase
MNFAELLRTRLGDDHAGLVFADGTDDDAGVTTVTWDAVVRASAARAGVLEELLADGDPDAPRHVGVLLENSAEYLYLVGGAAFSGVTIVGINPTRRGDELARDIRHTDCAVVITDTAQAALLEGLDLGAATGRVITVDSPAWDEIVARRSGEVVPDDQPPADHVLLLLFTSGSTSAPKAVVCTSTRLAGAGERAAAGYGVSRDDVCYLSMPLFHGNALMACFAPAVARGATVAIRPKFSASGWLNDVRRFGVTYFTYVGRTIAYVLARPPTPHDRDHRLRLGFGTEASALDRQRFADRFGCPLVEGYGSSESVVVIVRTPETPAGALGRPRPDDADAIVVVDPATGDECPRAIFDEHGGLVNGHEAIGELVHLRGGGAFEGYYRNTEATDERLRDGWYWTGDLTYRDADGFFWFAGRSADWLRVDSENFAAAPVENVLHRADGVVMVAVYAVPDPRTGDQVMAALELAPGERFDPAAFDAFLRTQRDLGTKWSPRFVRIVADMPLTANNKVHKGGLRAERWDTTDPVWWRPIPGAALAPMTDDHRAALRAEFAAHGRAHVLTL